MPFLAPVFAFIGSTLAAGGIGAFALRLGASLLLSAAASKLARKDVAQATMQGRTVSVREPVGARRIIYGRVRAGGTIVYMNTRTSGGITENALDLVIVLAGHRVRTIGAVYFDGELALDAAGTPQGRYSGYVSIQKQYGSESSTAFSTLASVSPGLWTAAHRIYGCAAMHISLTYNQDVYPTGIPNISVDIEGRSDIYDPRTGAMGYSENAALCLANYMADPVFGLGAAIGGADGIASAALIEAANVCDETVAKVGGGTEPRYSCNGILDTAVDPKSNIEGLLTAMAGTCGWQAGQWQIYAGAYRTPLLSLTSDDIVEAGLSVTTRISRAVNFNCVRGTFVAPENDWQQDDFPAYRSAAYIAEDGGETIWRDIVLPYTISASMAQRLAKIEVERNRRQLTVFLDGKLKCWQAAIGDTVSLSYARWGWSGKPFEVSNVNLGVSASDDGALLTAQLALRETSPLVYEWATSEAQVYAAAPRTTLPSAFDIAQPGNLTITESKLVTRDGRGVSAVVRLDWLLAPGPFVQQYEVQTRLAGGEWVTQGRTDQLFWEVNDIQPGDWEFRVKSVSGTGVSSPWRTVSQVIYGLFDIPVELASASIQSAGGFAILKWALSDDIDVRIGGNIVIRHSEATPPTWANSTSMDTLPGASTIAVVPLKPGAYILRPRDSSGQFGPQSMLLSSGAQAVAFAPITSLTEDTAFAGAKTNTVAYAGALVLASVDLVSEWPSISGLTSVAWGGGVQSTGTYEFSAGMDFLGVRNVRLRSNIVLESFAVNDLISSRTTLLSTWTSINGGDGSDVDCVVEAQTTLDDPAGAAIWSAWSRVDNTEAAVRGVRARAILTSDDPIYSPLVERLRLYADEVA